MTTARDVITTIICNAAGKHCGCVGQTCVRIADGLLADDSARLKLAIKLFESIKDQPPHSGRPKVPLSVVLQEPKP
jgi:hypothetical protein